MNQHALNMARLRLFSMCRGVPYQDAVQLMLCCRFADPHATWEAPIPNGELASRSSLTPERLSDGINRALMLGLLGPHPKGGFV